MSTKFTDVAYAVNRARAAYREHKDASHSTIEQAEAWVNSAAAQGQQIANALSAGHLKRSPTSGRMFIQLY